MSPDGRPAPAIGVAMCWLHPVSRPSVATSFSRYAGSWVFSFSACGLMTLPSSICLVVTCLP